MRETLQFGTDGWRALYKVGATQNLFFEIGLTVGEWLGEGGTILLVSDGRHCNRSLIHYFSLGLSAKDCMLFDAGIMPSGCGSFYAYQHQQHHLVVSITASHNSWEYCGIKFYDRAGDKLPPQSENELVNIWRNLEPNEYTLEDSHPLISNSNLTLSRHLHQIMQLTCNSLNLAGKTINIDCANGATSEIVGDLLDATNANIVQYHNSPNGYNINPKLQNADYNNNSWLTLIFDGDGDRLQVIDQTGRLLDGDQLLYYFAIADKRTPTPGVVGTVLSNSGLELALAANNIEFARADVGEVSITHKLNEKQWQLGGEPSGHIVDFNRMRSSDGLLNAIHLLKLLSQNDHDTPWRDDLQMWQNFMVNVAVETPKQAMKSTKIKQAINEFDRQYGNQARLLIRASGTENLLRVFIESQTFDAEKLAVSIAEQITS